MDKKFKLNKKKVLNIVIFPPDNVVFITATAKK